MKEEDKKRLKEIILHNLENHGIMWDEESNQVIVDNFRDVQQKLAEQTNFRGKKHKPKVQSYLAHPSEVDILRICPYLVAVESKAEHQRLWAYATSLWSVPITVGYGRRMRYFVFDRQNKKLIGIIGLCDPVIGLGVRDKESIEWSKDQKMQRLYNCMTAYILGAIPPYNRILGAKLVALTLLFPRVRQDFYVKYKDRRSIISGENKTPYLVYIDTLGAFGKSSIYNRLMNWEFINYTKGQSHLHMTANGSWESIREAVPEDVFETYEFGQGPNWKLRTLRRALSEIGLSKDMLSIGWKRGYYRCTLAKNWQEYLRGDSNRVLWKKNTQSDLVSHWYERWVLPRKEILEQKLHSHDGYE